MDRKNINFFNAMAKKSMRESHGFDEENEYLFELSVTLNEHVLEDTMIDSGYDVDWNYISKISAEIDYAIENEVAKIIDNVAVEEYHDDDSYNCTFWVRYDDVRANSFLSKLNYYDDYKRGNYVVMMIDCYEFADKVIDKLSKKFDSEIVSIVTECVTVEIDIPKDLFDSLN